MSTITTIANTPKEGCHFYWDWFYGHAISCLLSLSLAYFKCPVARSLWGHKSLSPIFYGPHVSNLDVSKGDHSKGGWPHRDPWNPPLAFQDEQMFMPQKKFPSHPFWDPEREQYEWHKLSGIAWVSISGPNLGLSPNVGLWCGFFFQLHSWRCVPLERDKEQHRNLQSMVACHGNRGAVVSLGRSVLGNWFWGKLHTHDFPLASAKMTSGKFFGMISMACMDWRICTEDLRTSKRWTKLSPWRLWPSSFSKRGITSSTPVVLPHLMLRETCADSKADRIARRKNRLGQAKVHCSFSSVNGVLGSLRK